MTSTRTLYGFVIPLASPLWTPNTRVNWRAKAAMVKRLRAESYLVACSEMTRLRIPLAEHDEHRTLRLTLLRGKGQRMLDFDSVVSACKPLLDSLSRPTAGGPGALLIADDDAAHVSCAYVQERAKDGRPALMVAVEA